VEIHFRNSLRTHNGSGIDLKIILPLFFKLMIVTFFDSKSILDIESDNASDIRHPVIAIIKQNE